MTFLKDHNNNKDYPELTDTKGGPLNERNIHSLQNIEANFAVQMNESAKLETPFLIHAFLNRRSFASFHALLHRCLVKWLEVRCVCPMCNKPIAGPPEQHHSIGTLLDELV